MGVYCTVCTNSFRKNKNISFFTYPKDSTRRQEWLIAVGRQDLITKFVEIKKRQTYRICEEHFEKSCLKFSKNRTVKYLFPNAFPTLKLTSNNGVCLGMNQIDNVTIQDQSIQFVPTNGMASGSNDLLIPKDTALSPWQHSLSITNGTSLNRAVICSSQSEDDFCISEQGTIADDWCIPAASRVCKLCLSMDAKMYQLKGNSLAKMYQDIMGMAPRTDADNRLPMGICWECTARLQSAASFRSKALYSDALLQDHLKNNADLTIFDIENLHHQHTNLKPTMAVQEVFKFNSHNADEHAPNTLIKSEVIGIPHNEEVEIEVQNLVSEKITIKDEGKNEVFEEINPNGDVKTEIDLIPITEMEVDGEDFEDFSEDDCRIVKENVYVNEMKVSLDNIVLFKSEGSTDTNKINLKLGEKGKDISSDDDERIDFIDVDDDAEGDNKAVDSENSSKRGVKKKKAVKRKVKTGDGGDTWDKGKRPKTSHKKSHTNQIKKKKQPYVKPSIPIDENIFTVKPLNHEDLRREILARRDSHQYIDAPFKCTVCFRGFPTEDKQARHVLKHTEKYGSIKCNICNVRMAKSRDLRAHMKRQHTSEFICKLCPMVTRNKNVALGHMKYHEGSKYECPQCSVEFEKKTTLLNHLRLKHMSACVCELCGYTFVSKIGVEVHKRMRHKLFDKNTEFKGQFCEVCEVKFLTQKAYNRHLRLSSKHIREDDPNRMSNDPSIKQRRLGASYMKDPRIRRPVIHRRDPNTEPPANGPVTCEQCGVVLESLRAYAAHFRHSHPGINRTQFDNTKTPYMCEHCGKFFNNTTTLSAHMWVHDGQKRFQCDHCHKSFTMKSNLAGHMQQHQAVRRMYDCRVCGKHFTFSYNLTRHMFLHTGLRPFKCDACEKTFRTSGELRSHVDHVHLKKPRPKRVRRKVKKVEMPSLEY